MNKLLAGLIFLSAMPSFASNCYVSNVGITGNHAPEVDELERRSEVKDLFFNALSDLGYERFDASQDELPRDAKIISISVNMGARADFSSYPQMS